MRPVNTNGRPGVEAHLPVGRANIVVRIRTDRGCEREINEDSGLCIRPEGELLASRGVLGISNAAVS